jgi:tol-pal system protein YbgF
MRRENLLTTAAFGLVFAAMATAPALAQSDEDRRLDRLDKDIHELRAIVFQGRDTGQPVVVKPAGPDPDVTAMAGRLDAMDASLRQITGQIEVLTHDVDQARQSASAAHDQGAQLQGQLKDLADRVAKLESGAAAAAQSSAPPSPGEAYKSARALFTAHDYAGAAEAFGAFISQYPTNPQTPTAYYWLGESDTARQAYAEAVPAYANALKGWPRTAWAADATVNLSRALAETSHTDQACAALGEFDRRYRAAAGSVAKARAAEVRIRAKCS